jgi:hypothetical protein
MSRLRTLYPHPPNYLDHAAEALAAVPGYDFRELVDRPLIAELMRDYPEIDLIEQIKAWRWYREDNPTTLRNPRTALRRWMAKAREFDL